MAPMKNKNKIICEGECSAAASKRRRIELLNPITEFPSSISLLQRQRNPPQNTTAIGTRLQLSPPSAFPQREDEKDAADDDALSSLIPQQNFIINYHINQMLLSVNEFWRSNLAEEVKKRKDMEASLKQKDELVDRFRQMYHYYEERTCFLEEVLQRRMTGEECSGAGAAAAEEEVESCFVELNSVGNAEMICRNCRSRPATMVWLPCRHLCVCLVCERRVKLCPICGVQKTESFMINL
ncbi:probable BOI-related E3 ubiquitin-protein ligase 2 [Cynara cardunculus var. scolymus]|uniref:probable BOI-related E3 ubiquitin-protein ligase 2 n=1 Tax=Cynara cardunculus var. scolymus TaxID=59895 RepID=UPI000D630826|nr:probable BOI-related E3 ubiquitin-protein ligase 2 [Cynara cardunculus var. scolymus]